jgi:threonine/homoserine/homoserine lactone efflux protein
MSTLWQGALIGFAIAAPVGPIGLLVIRRTLADGPVTGLATGLGAAVADGTYGLIAVLGLGALSAWLTGAMPALQLAGGALLIWLGMSALRAARRGRGDQAASLDAASLGRAFAGTFALTLANPMTILSFAGLIAALGAHGFAGGFTLLFGVVVGSAGWWLVLVGATHAARRALSARAARVIEAASGVALIGFGLLALATAANP